MLYFIKLVLLDEWELPERREKSILKVYLRKRGRGGAAHGMRQDGKVRLVDEVKTKKDKGAKKRLVGWQITKDLRRVTR